jgi:hypothetical protein
VDQGNGRSLIQIHRASSAFAETLSWLGRRVEMTAAVAHSSRKRALRTLQRFTPDTHDGATSRADPEENRNPGQDINSKNA